MDGKLLAMPFTAAFDRRKPFVVKHARLEPSARSLWELIEPFSNCTTRVPDEREWVPSDTPNFRRGKYAPFPFGRRGHFWWTSQLSRFMFRPRPALQTLIDEELAKIPRPFIGLQVRHGDKCRGDRPDGPGASAESFRTLDDRNRPEDIRIECGSFGHDCPAALRALWYYDGLHRDNCVEIKFYGAFALILPNASTSTRAPS